MQLNGFFLTSGVQDMLEGMDYCAVDIIFRLYLAMSTVQECSVIVQV